MESSFRNIFDKASLSSFCSNYETNEKVKQEDRDGNYFNKVGPNKYVRGMNGTYYIPYWCRYGLSRAMFYKFCAYHLSNGLKSNLLTGKDEFYINFAQYLPKVAPLCLDFDLVCKFTDDDKKKFKSGDDLHIYNFSHIIKIVEIINNIIFDNFEIEEEEIKAYVQEKDEFKFKDKEVVKDGLHIIYLLPFSVAERFFIRDELIKKLKEIDFIKSFNFEITNSYEEIVDEAVITRNPWLTYGSIKVTTKKLKDANGNIIYYTDKKGEKKAKVEFEHSLPYKLTHILDFDLYDENYDALGNMLTYDTEEELESLMNHFDLDQFSDEDPLDAKTEKAEEFIDNWEREDEEKKERIKSYKSKSISISTNSNSDHQEKHERRIYDYNLNTEILLKMVEILKKKEFFYTDRNTWLKICSSLHKNFTDHKIPEEDIKNALIDFSKCWKSFNLSHFEEEDYPLILYLSNTKDYSLVKPLECIKEIDQEKYDEINNFVNKKNKELTKEDLKPFYDFKKYKNNNSKKSFTSDKKIDRVFNNNSKLSKDENLDEILFEDFKEFEKHYYEEQKEKIKDDKKKTNEFKDTEYPFDNEFKHVQEYIYKHKTNSKRMVENLLCKYIEQYIKKILKKDYFYCYEIKTGNYEMVNDRYLKNCIPDKASFLMYDDYNNWKNENFNPLRIFSKYIELNGFNEINKLDYDNNLIKPRAYEEIYYINGCEVKEKIFNNGPIIPKYLVDDYKPYNDYDEKYKSFVQDFFKLVRIGLCSNNQEEYEYLKNWIINKILLKRNETIVVLQSTSQGCGKSTVTLLFQEILGSRYVTSSNDCSWLYSTFNSVLENKVLYCIEETTQTKSSNEWFNASGKLKDFITNPKILITHKFHDTVECNNYIDFIVTSNNYKTMPLETENRRYFIPKVSSKDTEIDELTKKINGILKGKEEGEFKTREEKEIYYKCFFAYCNENYNKDFRPSNIPLTKAMIDNNEIRMPFEIKYMKIFNLYEKRDLVYEKRDLDKKTGTFKIIFKSLLDRLKEFYDKLNGNDKMIEKYNYCQNSLNIFNHDAMKQGGVILKQVKSIIYNSLKLDEKKYYDPKIRIPGYNGYPGIVISYDELLESYKKNGYIDDLEYEKLKGNYDKVDYCDNSSISDFSTSSTIEELKIQLEEKDELIKKYIEELKEKDNIIEGLKRFTNEKADKEIENLKSYNKELNDKLEELKNDLQDKLDIIKIKDDQIEKLDFDIKEKDNIINIQKENLDNEKKELETFNEEKIKLENIIKDLKKDLEKDLKKNETENKNIDEIKDKVEKKIINYIEQYYNLNHTFNIYKEIVIDNKLTKKRLEKIEEYKFKTLGIDEITKQDKDIEEIKKQLNDIFKI